MIIDAPAVIPTSNQITVLDRLGDEIAELSAPLDARRRLPGGPAARW
jgi:hypothetical protein